MRYGKEVGRMTAMQQLYEQKQMQKQMQNHLPLDVTFIGLQQQPDGQPDLWMYNDNVTRSTFIIGPGETLEAAVTRKRSQFKCFVKA